jgi:serine/threonine protein kinase
VELSPLQEQDPKQIGSYAVVGRLGSGGMGHVYLGRTRGGRDVAVKVIKAELAGDTEFRERFRSEVAAARQVNGVYTAPVLDADPDASVPWMATAFVNGPSLHQAVTRQLIPERQVTALAAALAEALVSIHEVGLIHRDLKPSNVIMASDGPRVIDFGIARAAESTGLTGTGVLVGTPGFMAPEQVTGGEVVPRTDVFALGAVLTFAALGEGPFGRGTSASLLYRVVHTEPQLARINDPELRDLLIQCLHKEPGRRPTPEEILTRTGSTTLRQLPKPQPATAADVTVRQAPGSPTKVLGPPSTPAARSSSRLRPTRIAGWVIAGTAVTGTAVTAVAVISAVALLAAAVLWGPDLARTVWHWVPDVPGIDI